MQLLNIRLGSKRLTRELTSNVEISPDGWKLLDARSQIARGEVVAQLQGTRGNAPIRFYVRGTDLSATSLLTFWPKAQRMVSGTVDAEFQGNLADRCQGKGTVQITRARIANVPVSRIHIPTAWTVWPKSGHGQARFGADVRFATNGRAKSIGQLAWGQRLSIKGSAEVDEMDLTGFRTAVPQFGPTLTGKLKGKTTFTGRNIRSWEDLSGSFSGSLIQSKTLLLPAMNAVSTSLGLPSPGAITFPDTKIQGTFGDGSLVIQQMSLEAPEARMWLDGRLAYTGRLDFNVTADTGQLSAVNLAFGLINPLELLRRRLIFLEVTGNIESPIVYPRTDEALAQEVVLFFLPIASVR